MKAIAATVKIDCI